MVESTIKRLTKKLASLCKKNIPLGAALDVLESTSKKPVELLVINVLRESLLEANPNTSAA